MRTQGVEVEWGRGREKPGMSLGRLGMAGNVGFGSSGSWGRVGSSGSFGSSGFGKVGSSGFATWGTVGNSGLGKAGNSGFGRVGRWGRGGSSTLGRGNSGLGNSGTVGRGSVSGWGSSSGTSGSVASTRSREARTSLPPISRVVAKNRIHKLLWQFISALVLRMGSFIEGRASSKNGLHAREGHIEFIETTWEVAIRRCKGKSLVVGNGCLVLVELLIYNTIHLRVEGLAIFSKSLHGSQWKFICLILAPYTKD